MSNHKIDEPVIKATQVFQEDNDLVREAVLNLLVHKYPNHLSDEEIKKFIQNCYSALRLTR